jgi:Zn-finger nucleic acid-binding protein
MIHFCPNCQIGLNNNEMRLRFCSNCKHSWSEQDEKKLDEELTQSSTPLQPRQSEKSESATDEPKESQEIK